MKKKLACPPKPVSSIYIYIYINEGRNFFKMEEKQVGL